MAKQKKAKSGEGPIYPKGTLFLRFYAGKATAEDSTEYDMAYLPDGSPIIYSNKTQKWWAPGWQRLVDQAIKEGIDQ